jgi:conjugal transfer pilus assembly protein TraD
MLVVVAAFLLSPASLAPAWMVAGGALVGAVVSARVAGRSRARRAAVARAGDGTALGSDSRGGAVTLDDRQLSAHGLILGASGAGKSTTLLTILTDHIGRGRPVVAVDMKGSPSFARELASAAAAAGRPFRLWTPDGPDLWNPLQHGNATELKDKLIATERFTEPHYQRAAERYLQAALGVLHAAHPGRAATLDEVVSAMDPRRLAVLLRGLPQDQAARVQDYLGSLSPDQLSAIRGLGTRLAIISESHTGRFLSPSADPGGGSIAGSIGASIDTRAALAGEEVVLFSLNSSTYGKLAAQIGTLVVQDLVTAAGHKLAAGGAEARAGPAIVGIDEFSALGSDNVMALLARGREAGISVLLATQELADLDRAAPGLRDQVLGNTAVKIAHRQDVPASAQTVAQMAGTVRQWEETRQIGGGLFGSHSGSRGTRRLVDRFVVDPNEIKSLQTGEAVVIVKQPQARVATVRVAPPPARDGPAGAATVRVAPPPARDGPAGAATVRVAPPAARGPAGTATPRGPGRPAGAATPRGPGRPAPPQRQGRELG